MNRLSKIFSLLSALFVIVIVIFLVVTLWNKTENAALHSCISYVAGDLAEHPKEIIKFAPDNEDWNVINEEEAKKILKNVTFGDCPDPNSQPKDMKEKNLKIAVKKNDKHSFEIMVWSRGFDNISRTDDDIVSPYGEKPPQ